MKYPTIRGISMKRDKDLQNIADESIERLQNKDFHDRLMEERDAFKARKNNVDKRIKLTAICSVVALIVILVVAIPCAIWLWNGSGDDGDTDKYYNNSDDNSENPDLDKINAILSGYDIKSDCDIEVSLTKDNESGEDLYYTVEMGDREILFCRIDIVVDPDYEYFEIPTDESIEAAGLKMDCYRESVYDDEHGYYTHTVYAETVIGDVRIYFNVYAVITEDEDDGFAAFLESVLIKE